MNVGLANARASGDKQKEDDEVIDVVDNYDDIVKYNDNDEIHENTAEDVEYYNFTSRSTPIENCRDYFEQKEQKEFSTEYNVSRILFS